MQTRESWEQSRQKMGFYCIFRPILLLFSKPRGTHENLLQRSLRLRALDGVDQLSLPGVLVTEAPASAGSLPRQGSRSALLLSYDPTRNPTPILLQTLRLKKSGLLTGEKGGYKNRWRGLLHPADVAGQACVSPGR